MAEWLYEAGIGEARAALIEDNAIRAARIECDDGRLRPGTVVAGRLSEITLKGREGVVTVTGGTEVLLSPLPAGATLGATVRIEIVRAALPEHGRVKRARAVPSEQEEGPGPDLLARITASGLPVRRLLTHHEDALEAAGWSEIIEEARSGEIAFERGALRVALTPAMTLIDVDGVPPLEPLAIAAASAAAATIERLGITGSIGIDFPTLGGRAARQSVAAAIDASLPQPFERTAMNGFGFLQIVRRRSRVSLLELVQADPIATEVRALLRRIERTPPPGERKCRVSRAQLALIRARGDWTAELARRTGVLTTFSSAEEA